MKNHLLALVLGALFAAIIACGGAGAQKPLTGSGKPSPHDEIAQLDARITADLAKLDEPRPAAVEPMASKIPDLTTDDATCHPAQTPTCTESCSLKKSICESAARICTIASDLGGNDSYANDKCSSGAASCEAAKKRCCNCT